MHWQSPTFASQHDNLLTYWHQYAGCQATMSTSKMADSIRNDNSKHSTIIGNAQTIYPKARTANLSPKESERGQDAGHTLNPKAICTCRYSSLTMLQSSNFLRTKSLAGTPLCSKSKTIGAKLSPQLGFKNPKNETLESYSSKAVGTRTLNFGVQIATGGAI